MTGDVRGISGGGERGRAVELGEGGSVPPVGSDLRLASPERRGGSGAGRLPRWAAAQERPSALVAGLTRAQFPPEALTRAWRSCASARCCAACAACTVARALQSATSSACSATAASPRLASASSTAATSSEHHAVAAAAAACRPSGCPCSAAIQRARSASASVASRNVSPVTIEKNEKPHRSDPSAAAHSSRAATWHESTRTAPFGRCSDAPGSIVHSAVPWSEVPPLPVVALTLAAAQLV